MFSLLLNLRLAELEVLASQKVCLNFVSDFLRLIEDGEYSKTFLVI